MKRTSYAGSASELLARAQAAPDQWSQSTLLLYERAANALAFENDERRSGETFMHLVRLHSELAFSDDFTSDVPGQTPILLLDRNQRRQHLRLGIEFATQARRAFLFANSISQLDATAAIVELRYHLGEREKSTPDEMFLAAQHSLAGNGSEAAEWYWRAARSGAKRAEDKPPDPFESFEEPNSASFRNFTASITHLIRVGKYTGAANVALSMASTPKLIVQDQTRYYALACLCLIAAKLPEKVPQQHFMHGSRKFAGTESGQKLLSLAKACETRNFTEVNSALKKKRVNQLIPSVSSASDNGFNILPQVMPVLEAIRYEYGTYTGKEAPVRGVAPARDSHDYLDPSAEPTFGKGKQRAASVSSSTGGSSFFSPDSATQSLLASARATPLPRQPQPNIYHTSSSDPVTSPTSAQRTNLSQVAAYAPLSNPPASGFPPVSRPHVSRLASGGSVGPAGYTPSPPPASVPEQGLLYSPSPGQGMYAPPGPEINLSLAAAYDLPPADLPPPPNPVNRPPGGVPLPTPPGGGNTVPNVPPPIPPSLAAAPPPAHEQHSSEASAAPSNANAPHTPAAGLSEDSAPPPAYAPPVKGSRFSSFLRSKN